MSKRNNDRKLTLLRAAGVAAVVAVAVLSAYWGLL
jgi:hypothetical protein